MQAGGDGAALGPIGLLFHLLVQRDRALHRSGREKILPTLGTFRNPSDRDFRARNLPTGKRLTTLKGLKVFRSGNLLSSRQRHAIEDFLQADGRLTCIIFAGVLGNLTEVETTEDL